MDVCSEFLLLPKRYWTQHKQCELLVKQIEEFITNDVYNGLRIQNISLDAENDIKKGEHIFDYLLRKGRIDEHDEFIRKSLVNALIIDVCYFLQEALSCSKRKRLTVAFSLLRKPFVYHLPIFLRILFDADYLDRFNKQESFDGNFISKNDLQELIKQSLNLLLASKELEKEEIYDWIFNSENPDSLINLSNKALHLTTTRNPHNKTELQNLNFIFSNQDDIENLWNYIYHRIPALLLYLLEVIEPLVFTLIDLPYEKYEQRLEERIKILTTNYSD